MGRQTIQFNCLRINSRTSKDLWWKDVKWTPGTTKPLQLHKYTIETYKENNKNLYNRVTSGLYKTQVLSEERSIYVWGYKPLLRWFVYPLRLNTDVIPHPVVRLELFLTGKSTCSWIKFDWQRLFFFFLRILFFLPRLKIFLLTFLDYSVWHCVFCSSNCPEHRKFASAGF